MRGKGNVNNNWHEAKKGIRWEGRRHEEKKVEKIKRVNGIIPVIH